MKKIVASIRNNRKDLYLDVSLRHSCPAAMTLNSAAIYWKYKNVITGENDQITYGVKKISSGEGH